MKSKNNRLDSIKMIISSKEIGSQGELLAELEKRFPAYPSHAFTRPETAESGKSGKHEWQLCVCFAQQHHV